ncbi:CD209 antigen isoform X2 [Etheostoma spectabile]|uniref:C-type lectin domain-containing protein n=1 Tax=Etheostoma spectabile TaxID=54343 RepID=A0A5J5CNA3_9PERO|nr:CD209 antigen-like isoform X2 [Etheostoma spectabile]KAA8582253.1 hypothetical protein FQN60_008993 [Etheostoma spectabile]
MEDGETSAGIYDGSYNKLIYQGDDEHTLYSNQEKQVSLSMVRPESIWNHYKVLTVSLAVLAALLLAVDIGLGVYYSKLTDGQHIMDISNEVAKLQATYSDAIQSRDEAKKQLASEIKQQEFTKWEIEHENKRSTSFEKLSDKIQMEIAVLKSHIPMINEGCRHCLPGWTFMNSLCYYFAFLDTLSRRSWQEARQFCTNLGGDLAVVDNRETHLAISELINTYQDQTIEISIRGFWIGLRDVEQEGIWKWLDGRTLNEGFWNNGEPNNIGNEDCAAAYPRSNPLLSWNDAPCNYELKWICQMAPRSSSESQMSF